jgi:hypothetical protein
MDELKDQMSANISKARENTEMINNLEKKGE